MENIREFNTNNLVLQKELILKIFIIGYNPMGESIVILILADNIVKFSAVIDCFESEEHNLTMEILNEYNIDELDLICLTHPHKDHCKGLEKILNKANNKTTVLYPSNILINSSNYDPDVTKVVDKVSYLLTRNKNNTNKPKIKGCVNSYKVPIKMSFANRNNGDVYPLEINTYSPVSEIIERPIAKNYIKEVNSYQNSYNNFSIMISLALGDFKILLCSDIENPTIDIVQRDLNQSFFSNTIHILKIPHHSSNTSINILNLLKGAFISNSVTTIYGSAKLPSKDMLEKYKRKSEKVFCTSSLDNKNKYNYGIIEITTNIFDKTIKIEDKKYDETEI